MLRVFLKKHDFDPDMLTRVMLIKKAFIHIKASWKVSKYGVSPDPCFPVFGLNTRRKYEPEITPYLDTFYVVTVLVVVIK